MQFPDEKPIEAYHRIMEALRQPFPMSEVKFRASSIYDNRDGRTNKKFPKKTKPLAYIDARALFDRLDEVCTYGWTCEVEDYRDGVGAIARIGIRFSFDGPWMWRGDVGTDSVMDKHSHGPANDPKGGVSDALKRAGVPWGIFRYAYNVKTDYALCWVRDNGKFGGIDKGSLAAIKRDFAKQVESIFGGSINSIPVSQPEPQLGPAVSADPNPDADITPETSGSTAGDVVTIDDFKKTVAMIHNIPELTTYWNDVVPPEIKKTELKTFQARLQELKAKE